MTELLPVPFLIAATWTDLQRRRIPNRITYPLIAAGTCLQLYEGRLAATLLATAAVLFLFLCARYRAVRLGGGDIKLMLGCLLFLTGDTVGPFLVLAALTSLCLAMGLTVRARGLGHFCQLAKLELLTLGSAPQEAVHLPGAPVLLAAYLLTLAGLHWGAFL